MKHGYVPQITIHHVIGHEHPRAGNGAGTKSHSRFFKDKTVFLKDHSGFFKVHEY